MTWPRGIGQPYARRGTVHAPRRGAFAETSVHADGLTAALVEPHVAPAAIRHLTNAAAHADQPEAAALVQSDARGILREDARLHGPYAGPLGRALLQSLQVKQQLGVQALSIANQSPQYLLSLFK